MKPPAADKPMSYNDQNHASVMAITNGFHTTEVTPGDHHSSHTGADTTPADHYVGKATPTEHSHTTVRATPSATCCSHITIAEATVAEEDLSRPRAEAFSEEDFCCPICLDLLLRPVVLACGHRLCRGCWCRMLQGREMRATANLTGFASCPLGRCERPWSKGKRLLSDATARQPTNPPRLGLLLWIRKGRSRVRRVALKAAGSIRSLPPTGEVKPHVPEVETILESEIEALFSAQRLSRLRCATHS